MPRLRRKKFDSCKVMPRAATGSIEVCALLTKPERRRVDLPIRYVGFEIPNRFAVGYGLDHAQRHRNLHYVPVLDEESGRASGPPAPAGGPRDST